MSRKKKSPVRRGKMVDGKYWFDHDAAARACSFFENVLIHVEGPLAGEPFHLADWQAHKIIEPAFGWKRADGTRRYRIVFVAIPRKNGKSTLGAGIGLFLLVADGEARAQVYSCAADRAQARIVFDTAAVMAQKSPDLADRLQLLPGKGRMIHAPSASFYQALSADAFSKHGLNSHGYVFDEIHTQKNRDLYDVMRTSTGARMNPMGLGITTAGFDRHSICAELWAHAEAVAAGDIEDDEFLPVIYAARPLRPYEPKTGKLKKTDPDHPLYWTTPKAWKAANPNLGISLRPDAIESEVKRALNNPASENAVKQLHLNIWTEQATRWLSMALWDACADPEYVVKRGRRGFFGLDLARTTDLSALVGVFPPDDEDMFWRVEGWFFCPEERIRERARRDRVPYEVWQKEGLLEATPGDVTDYEYIEVKVLELLEQFDMVELPYDRTFAGELVTNLQREEVPVLPFGQGYLSMSPACVELERMVRGAKLRHNGHPILRWNMANVTISRDAAGNIKMDKAKSTERIDGRRCFGHGCRQGSRSPWRR